MHGYYLHYRDIDDSNQEKTGIERKVEGQVKALNDAGLNCDFILCPQPESTIGMVKSCLPFFPDGVHWPDREDVKTADYLYIRRPRFASKQLINFLAAVKETNPNITVIYEVPTYPYDMEMDSLKMRPAWSKDRRYRGRLHEYVDYVSDLSGASRIFEMPTVQIFNGIDLDRVKLREPRPDDQTLHLLFVAMFMDWHAADRMIRGIADYNKNEQSKRVVLHLVGEGEALPSLKGLAKSLEVEDNVVFHGYCNSDEMDELYNICEFGIASLGLHRIGLETASTLKTREYLAKGLPFVYSGKIDVFRQDPVDFCLQVPADDSPVAIDGIVSFYNALMEKETSRELAARIRDYADEHVGMDAAMANVINLLKEESADVEQ